MDGDRGIVLRRFENPSFVTCNRVMHAVRWRPSGRRIRHCPLRVRLGGTNSGDCSLGMRSCARRSPVHRRPRWRSDQHVASPINTSLPHGAIAPAGTSVLAASWRRSERELSRGLGDLLDINDWGVAFELIFEVGRQVAAAVRAVVRRIGVEEPLELERFQDLLQSLQVLRWLVDPSHLQLPLDFAVKLPRPLRLPEEILIKKSIQVERHDLCISRRVDLLRPSEGGRILIHGFEETVGRNWIIFRCYKRTRVYRPVSRWISPNPRLRRRSTEFAMAVLCAICARQSVDPH